MFDIINTSKPTEKIQMLTTKKIVKAIKENFGVDVQMFKGNGYYYFIGECLEEAKISSVDVYTINELSLEQWMNEFKRLL